MFKVYHKCRVNACFNKAYDKMGAQIKVGHYMRKILLMICLSVFPLYATELNWVDSYKDAISKAKSDKKNIMVLITTSSCRWCRKLELETLVDKSVIKRLNSDYVSLHVTRGKDEYPSFLQAPGVPTTYFLDADGKPIIKRVMGYWNVEDYLSFLDDVDYKLGRKEY